MLFLVNFTKNYKKFINFSFLVSIFFTLMYSVQKLNTLSYLIN